MKTFFYSIQKSCSSSDCHWQMCPQGYLARMRASDTLRDVYPIFNNVSYVSPAMDTIPRNGDIVILYSENAQQLDNIIEAKESFDGLKKILVVADSNGASGDKYHKLAPRFITQAQRNIAELEAVISKMKEQAL